MPELNNARKYPALLHALNERFKALTEILAEPVPPLLRPEALVYAAKDIIDIRGRAPSLGLSRAPGSIPDRTAPVIDRLAEHGMSLIGFAAMTPLAYEPSGANQAQGRPINPWSAQHICGGSSSGSAVAVASRMVRLALGSDTAGSLRIPSHCCGVTAWKPAASTVPSAGTMALAPTLDAIGFLAQDAFTLIPLHAVFENECSEPREIKRIATAEDIVRECDPNVAAAVHAVEAVIANKLAELGQTNLVSLIESFDAPVLTILQGEAWTGHRALVGTGLLEPMLEKRLSKGQQIGEAHMQEARIRLKQLAAGPVSQIFESADAILLPVMRGRTPLNAVCDPGSHSFSARAVYELSALTRWVNGAGLPAVSIPAGFDRDGLPIAVQIVGRPKSSLALLKLAAKIQDRTDWHRKVPPAAAIFGVAS
jgi:Asp-tRNA(Asn)/Glu-tRNA(Gln) amidotransferase A subunit family amidase